MRILAVDTTGAHGSVALLERGELKGLIGLWPPSPHHAEKLLVVIDELLLGLSLRLEDVDGYAVAAGPGSFTGLRIGIATIAGLSFARGRPAVGVSALEATAYRFRRVDGLLVAMLEAYRGEVYGAAYEAREGLLSEVVAPLCDRPEAFLDSLPEPPAVVAGTGILRHREAVVSRHGERALADASFFLAEEVARLSEAKLAAGEGTALGKLEALYIRPSEAERNREREASGSGK